MISLFKYRKWGIMILIMQIVAFLLALVAVWNFLLVHDEARNEGWIILFTIVLFVCGIGMFFIVYRISDQEIIENHVQALLDKKKEITAEQTAEEETESEDSLKEETIEETVQLILEGLDKAEGQELFDQLLRKLSRHIDIVQGVLYIKQKKSRKFKPAATYALSGQEPEPFETGEGIAGQAAADKALMRIIDIPEAYYEVFSGLGSAKPKHLLFIPVLYKDRSIGLIEAGIFKKPDQLTEVVLNRISVEAGKLLNNHIAN